MRSFSREKNKLPKDVYHPYNKTIIQFSLEYPMSAVNHFMPQIIKKR